MGKELHECEAHERRIVLVATPKTREEIRKRLVWRYLFFGSDLPLPASTSALQGYAAEVLIPSTLRFGLRLHSLLKGHRGLFPYPVIEPQAARTHFQFPMSHPVDGHVYACSEGEPLLYVPLERFHRYMFEAKLAAFQWLCSALRARRVSVVSVVEDGKGVTASFRLPPIETEGGPFSSEANAAVHSRHRSTASTVYEYAQSDRPPVEYDSPWMAGEPTWKSMQRLRLEEGLEKCRAELNYQDDMGVNGEVSAFFDRINLKLGGKFEEMKSQKIEFDVEFWPIQ